MDIQPQNSKPISDDQELAKVLAGITAQADNNFKFEETPAAAPTAAPTTAPATDTPAAPATDEKTDAPAETEKPAAPVLETPVIGYNPPAMPQPTAALKSDANVSDLEGIKKDALLDLRPLVDKLELSAEEKFDIYLLLLRSTDDKTLVAPAYKTAQDIADESKRAQALLDIIKEIDFFSSTQQ